MASQTRQIEPSSAGVSLRSGAVASAVLVSWLLASLCVTAPVRAGFVAGTYAYGNGDYVKAYAIFRREAEQGTAAAQYYLGMMYRLGRGVKKDYFKAVRWYREAAEQGDVEAQYSLAVMYHRVQGVERDYAEAVRWYRAAAGQGHRRAELRLGVMYEKGQGVQQDFAEAARWYHMAAEKGQDAAQLNLGRLYYRGWGVAVNKVEAHKWVSLFLAQRPDSQHAWILGEIEENMTAMEIVEAKERAKNWRSISVR